MTVFKEALDGPGIARTTILSGLRGVGKTVLLQEFQRQARARAWAATIIEAGPDIGLFQSLAERTPTLLDALGQRRRLRSIAAMVETLRVSVGVAEVTLGRRDTVAPNPQLVDAATTLLVELGRTARRKGAGVALFVDEMQVAPASEVAAFARALQACSNEEVPVVAAGAGLPNLPNHVMRAVSHSERIQYLDVGYLSVDETLEALTVPAAHQGVRFEPAALEVLVEASGGFPFFVQLYGRLAWSAAGGADVIDRAAADTAQRMAWPELHHGIFGGRWSQASPAERDYLGAMARLSRGGDELVPSNQVAALLDKTSQELSVHRQRLIDKGLIYADGRFVGFQLPHFGPYVTAQMTTGGQPAPEVLESLAASSRRRQRAIGQGPPAAPVAGEPAQDRDLER